MEEDGIDGWNWRLDSCLRVYSDFRIEFKLARHDSLEYHSDLYAMTEKDANSGRIRLSRQDWEYDSRFFLAQKSCQVVLKFVKAKYVYKEDRGVHKLYMKIYIKTPLIYLWDKEMQDDNPICFYRIIDWILTDSGRTA